jgi:hypothetical protein
LHRTKVHLFQIRYAAARAQVPGQRCWLAGNASISRLSGRRAEHDLIRADVAHVPFRFASGPRNAIISRSIAGWMR